MIGAGDTRRRQASVVTRISRAARSRLLTLQVELTRSIKDAAEHVRSRHLFVWDVLGLTIASVLALALYIDTARVDFSVMDLWWVVALVVATRSVVNLAIELYHYAWRYAGVADMGRILFCVGFGSVASAASVLLAIGILETFGMQAVRPDLTFWSNELLLALVVMATPRFAIRAVTDLGTPSGAGIGGGGVRTLLYGAGWAGVLVARSAQRGEANVRPVGFLDDDPRITGRRINGLPVYGGLEAMARSIRRSRATALLVTMPSAPGDVIRRVVASAIELGLTVRTVPPMTDILDGTLDASRVRNVRVEDLLRRPMSSEHSPGVKRLFTGRTALITGAGGSIGSELARQLLAVEPRRIILVDRAESALYLIQRELEALRVEGVAHGAPWQDLEIVSKLSNVADGPAMRRLFQTERPDVVLHAAAYKHVPVLEEFPSEAVRANIGGTMAVVDAAAAAGVAHFVLVSTDKAVEPSSVMGATKRMAEMVVADTARRTGRPYISVRFGNVLGSNGSVVPIFQSQLERGLPLTITHPEMTRYFMTIPEAAWLLLDAAALADRGGLYVLDMGTPVRIVDIARDLVRLSGRDPHSVTFEVIGLRPGEKLHEELFYDQETAIPTAVSKVLRIDSPEPPLDVRERARELIAMATGLDDEHLKSALHAWIAMTPDQGAPPSSPSDDPPSTGSRRDRSSGAARWPRPARPWVAIPVGAREDSSRRRPRPSRPN